MGFKEFLELYGKKDEVPYGHSPLAQRFFREPPPIEEHISDEIAALHKKVDQLTDMMRGHCGVGIVTGAIAVAEYHKLTGRRV